jgi:hypothetical protein
MPDRDRPVGGGSRRLHYDPRCGGLGRDGRGAPDHHGHQRLGMALAARQLRGAGRLGAEPERAGAGCAVASDDAGGICGVAGPARGGTGGLRGAGRTSRCGDQRHRVGGRTGWPGDYGQPDFVVAGSMLGAPGISLPVLDDGGLPLGLQVLGFPQGDADLFGVAGWIEDALHG